MLSKYVSPSGATPGEIFGAIEQFDGMVGALSKKPGKGKKVTIGGLPGIRYDDVDVPAKNEKSRLVFSFDQRNHYFINCQSHAERRAEATRACDLILETFDSKS